MKKLINALNSCRKKLRDALPLSVGLLLTLRANPILGLGFRTFQKHFKIDGMTFEVPLEQQSLSSLASYWFKDYELAERNFINAYIRPSDKVCELGGCLGVVSMTINRLLQDPKTHLVVEANPALIHFLERNRKRNNGDFQIRHCAVGGNKPLQFSVSGNILTNRVANEVSQETVIVEALPLSALISEYGSFDVLVMDIEGSEKYVILSDDESWKAMRLIILEWHPSIMGQKNFEKAQEKMSSAGFECLASEKGQTHIVEVWTRE